MTRRPEVALGRLRARAFTVPTGAPEGDGTLRWHATTAVVAEVDAGARRGLGWSYTHAAAARLIREVLAPSVEGLDALAPRAAWIAMRRAVRNLGRPGLAASAIAAVDTALWDLKARLHGVPLADLWGRVRERVPLYASGGFVTDGEAGVAAQLGAWAAQGFERVKMKIGARERGDLGRVAAARDAVGPGVELFVDANGAYTRQDAARAADRLGAFDVRWFEEPLSSDDRAGLRWLRARVPPGMAVTTGEYAYDAFAVRKLLDEDAVDVLQADVTRCEGYTGLDRVAALAAAAPLPLSLHTAPTLHVHAACCLEPVVHLEWFHDHARLEPMLFDGVPRPEQGALAPPDRPGHGVSLKEGDAARFAV